MKAYERLKREQHIDTLFQTGKAFSVFPIKAVHTAVPRGEELSPVQVGFSVPKKRFKLSVKRHRIRRLMAEAWRLNKHPLYAALPPDKQLRVFLIFTGGDLPSQQLVTETIIKVIDRLISLYTNQETDAQIL